jgi:CheY-like chemotaxis protein
MSSPPLRALLLVDDRTPLLQYRKAILESLGYSVITAATPSMALVKLENCTVDAVLLEYKSEGLDAEATAFHIKQHFPSLPIVLLSAYSCMPERILWLVDEYVMKSDFAPHGRSVLQQFSATLGTRLHPRTKAESLSG